MFTLKVISSVRQYFQAEGKEKLIVDFHIVSDDEEPKTERRSLAFDLDDSEESIKEVLQKYVNNYNVESESAIANVEKDRAEAQANETIEALEGFEISNEDTTVEEERDENGK